jgi:5-deoxy-glucuronate isomerase
MNEGHYRKAGSMAANGFALELTPESVGWEYASLRIVNLEPRQTVDLATLDHEMIVLPIEGSCTVVVDSERFDVEGRTGVFARVSDFVYAPRDAHLSIFSEFGGRFALPGAHARKRLEPRYQPASATPVELRGAGDCSRQLVNFCTPQSFDADRLIAVEAYVPHGNWATYPPHKHDTEGEGETALEEIYYYEIADGPDGQGMCYQRVYASDERPIDVLAEVRTGDAVLIPHGWHGPSMAAPGYNAYFLNVMAGPGDVRAWKVCEDPSHTWVRDGWSNEPVDPRLPLPGFDTGNVASNENWGR